MLYLSTGNIFTGIDALSRIKAVIKKQTKSYGVAVDHGRR